VNASAVYAYPAIYFNTASGIAYVDNAQLYVGAAPVPPYYPLPAEEDVRRCLRYYQKLRVSTRFPSFAAGQINTRSYPLPVPMSAVPTAAVTAGTRSNVSSTAVGSVAANGFYYNVTATAGVSGTGTDTYAIDDIVTLETA
jgi:hypothetical protein